VIGCQDVVDYHKELLAQMDAEDGVDDEA